MKQTLIAIALFGFLGLLAGCTEVIVPGAFTGASEVYNYSTSNAVDTHNRYIYILCRNAI